MNCHRVTGVESIKENNVPDMMEGKRWHKSVNSQACVVRLDQVMFTIINSYCETRQRRSGILATTMTKLGGFKQGYQDHLHQSLINIQSSSVALSSFNT